MCCEQQAGSVKGAVKNIKGAGLNGVGSQSAVTTGRTSQTQRPLWLKRLLVFTSSFKFACLFVKMCTCGKSTYTSLVPGQMRDYGKWIIKNLAAHSYPLSNLPNWNTSSLRKLLFKTFQIEFSQVYFARAFLPSTCFLFKLFITAASGMMDWFDLS